MILRESESTSGTKTTPFSYLPYITLFANYKNILKYNKPTLNFFHKTFYNIFSNLLSNPIDISKQEIFKKISSYFKVHTLFEYFSLFGSFDESKNNVMRMDKYEKTTIVEEIKDGLGPDKLEKADLAIIYKIIMKISLILRRNLKKIRKELYQTKKEKKTELLQIFNLINDFKTSYEPEKISTNILVIELMEISEVICVIVPLEPSFLNEKEKIPTLNDMEIGLNEICENPDKNIDNFIPEEIHQFFKKLKLETEEMVDKDNIMALLLESFFMEKEYSLKKIFWRIDKFFLYEYYMLVQISKIIFLMLKMNKIELKKNKNFYEEMIKTKENLSSQITPNISKEAYKQVFKTTNYNYLLALMWISDESFPNSLIFYEFQPKENEILKDCINPLRKDEEKTPLSMFYIFLYKLQVCYSFYFSFSLLNFVLSQK